MPSHHDPEPTRRRPRNDEVHRCLICNRFHSLRFCKQFLEMNVDDRIRCARRFHYCLNCLARTHTDLGQCGSQERCKKCNKLHHTLLHRPRPGERPPLKAHRFPADYKFPRNYWKRRNN